MFSRVGRAVAGTSGCHRTPVLPEMARPRVCGACAGVIGRPSCPKWPARAGPHPDPERGPAAGFPHPDPQLTGQQIRAVPVTQPPRQRPVAELLAGPPGDLTGEGGAAGVDQPAECLPSVGVGEEAVVGHHRRPARDSGGEIHRLLELSHHLHAHIVTPPTDSL